ncbi:MAG TPA: glycosyltransferase, partial [Chroococcales cyanobacterium]
MRVGIDGRMLYHSGIGRYIQNILLALPSPELRMVVWLNEKGMRDKRLDSPFIEKRLLRSPVFSPFEQVELAWKARCEQLDLFHAPHINAPLLYPGKLVVTVHDLIPLLFPGTIAFSLGERYFSAMVRWSTRRASKILTVSENTRTDLISFGVDEGKIFAVLNGVDPLYGEKISSENLSASLGLFGIKKPFLLYAGQWKKYKNVLGLIRAFAAARRNFPDLSLVLVGRVDRR